MVRVVEYIEEVLKTQSGAAASARRVIPVSSPDTRNFGGKTGKRKGLRRVLAAYPTEERAGLACWSWMREASALRVEYRPKGPAGRPWAVTAAKAERRVGR